MNLQSTPLEVCVRFDTEEDLVPPHVEYLKPWEGECVTSKTADGNVPLMFRYANKNKVPLAVTSVEFKPFNQNHIQYVSNVSIIGEFINVPLPAESDGQLPVIINFFNVPHGTVVKGHLTFNFIPFKG